MDGERLMTTVVLPAVITLLLPLVAFAPIALLPPFRRLGRGPAIWWRPREPPA